MIIKEEINTKDNTKFIFDLGDIVLRNDVRYDQDVRKCFEYFLKQNILQNPIIEFFSNTLPLVFIIF